MDEVSKCLPSEYARTSRVDAGDMDTIDDIMNKLRENAPPGST